MGGDGAHARGQVALKARKSRLHASSQLQTAQGWAVFPFLSPGSLIALWAFLELVSVCFCSLQPKMAPNEKFLDGEKIIIVDNPHAYSFPANNVKKTKPVIEQWTNVMRSSQRKKYIWFTNVKNNKPWLVWLSGLSAGL